jgi:lysophospholipase L1-like esterase
MKTLKIVFAVFFCILLVRETSGQQKITRVAIIGNSITEGSGLSNPTTYSYPSQLAKMLGTEWLVGNFGVSGRTMLKKGDFPIWKEKKFTDALNFEPNIVIIMLGTNDSKYYNWVYKDDFYKDYISMIDTFSQLASKPEIYVCYPLKVFKHLYDINDTIIHDEIIPIVHQISLDKNLKIIDCNTPTSDKPYLLADGIHPNIRGAHFVAQIFYNSLTGNSYKELYDENLLLKKLVQSNNKGDGTNVPKPDQALDGDLISSWTFKGFPSFITVDIGSVQPIDQFELFFREDKLKGIQYKIETSIDSLNWTLVVDQTTRKDLILSYGIDKIQLTDARYVRLTVTSISVGTDDVIRIHEFKALKYHGYFHAPIINAEIPVTLSNTLNLIPPENIQNISFLIYSKFYKAFDYSTFAKDALVPFSYKFKATMNNQYIYMTDAYSNGIEVYSDTIKLKFANPTFLANPKRTDQDYFQVFPNPSGNQIRIVAMQPINEKVTIKILGMKGELIGTIPTQRSMNKNEELVWKGADSYSKKLVSGIYFISIDGPTIHENMKVLVN